MLQQSRNKEDAKAATHGGPGVLEKKLAGKGLRLTAQRRILLRMLETASTHLDVPHILKEARRAGVRMDRATVYRTLNLLKRHGLVDELDLLHLEGTGHYYELRESGDHVHVGCTRCGRILELETSLLEKLRAQVQRKTGYDVSSVRTEVAGVCPACRTK
jgi:Fe2+ or Zn2+ uptake regulation protein